MRSLANPKQNELCLLSDIELLVTELAANTVRLPTHLQSVSGNDDNNVMASLVSIHAKALYYEQGHGHNSELHQ
jgi:hypothetical protein